MNTYETLVIMNPELTEEQVAELTTKLSSVIEQAGEVKEVDQWGKKRLAYEIDKVRDGYYTLITFSSEPSVLDELNHVYRITEKVLRGIIVKLDK